MSATSPHKLLPSELTSKLGRMQVVAKRLFTGRMKGERRSRQRGTSTEFADFRNYTLGDDPRFVDWNSYGRLDRLFLKLFVEEEDLFVYLLLDTSGSMNFGAPVTKILQMQRMAAALSYMTLLHSDRVILQAFTAGPGPATPPRRGRSQFRSVLEYLSNLEPGGTTDLEDTTRKFCVKMRRPGVVIVLSDFLAGNGYEAALNRLLHAGCEVFAVQVLSPEDSRPDLAGDLQLVDSEDDTGVEITITDRLLRNYRAEFDAYQKRLAAFCRARAIAHVVADTTTPIETLLLRTLPQAGLVR